MYKYKAEITIQSDTLFASSEGTAIIDAVTKTYKSGIPYIPAKTLKGLWKENAIEVQEIMGNEWNPEDSEDIINKIFGREGTENKGIIRFYNADIRVRNSLKKDIRAFKLHNTEVLKYFTKIRQQTAMDNGVAKDGSLRSFRVLKKGLIFKTYLESDLPLNEASLDLLNKAGKNLRRAGMNRNRGFGKIKIGKLKRLKPSNKSDEILQGNIFKISLQSPALLPASQVDANTVSTERVVSGRKILGMLASQYIRLNSHLQKKDIHHDSTFSNLFLDGNVKFSNAYPLENNRICLPLGLHWTTDKGKTEVYTDYSDVTELNTKSINGYYSTDGKEKSEFSTVLDFHNSRNKVVQENKGNHTRISGSNRGAGIYYYEKLAKGTSFVFSVDGEEEELAKIRELLQNYKQLRLGKATSAELGKIKVENFDGNWLGVERDESTANKDCMLTFISPVILKNELGAYDVSLEIISDYIGVAKLEAKSCRLRTERVQVFQNKIEMQLPECLAIAPGSSIYLDKAKLSKDLIDQGKIGEFIHEGYGEFILESNPIQKKQNLKVHLPQDDSEETKIERPKIQITNETSNFLRAIHQERHIQEANQKANQKANRTLHRGTTMNMIKLFRDVIFRMGSEDNFDSSLKECIGLELTKKVYSKKTVEEIGIIIGKLKTNIKDKRKSNPLEFKDELTKWMVKGFKGNAKEIETNAIAYYWLAYFNKIKINNRDAKNDD